MYLWSLLKLKGGYGLKSHQLILSSNEVYRRQHLAPRGNTGRGNLLDEERWAEAEPGHRFS